MFSTLLVFQNIMLSVGCASMSVEGHSLTLEGGRREIYRLWYRLEIQAFDIQGPSTVRSSPVPKAAVFFASPQSSFDPGIVSGLMPDSAYTHIPQLPQLHLHGSVSS